MSRTIMQQALDALNGGLYRSDSIVKAIAALEAELAKPEPRNDAAWYWHNLYKAKCEEIEFGFAITPTPKLAKPEMPMSPEHLPQYIANNGIKPVIRGGGGAGSGGGGGELAKPDEGEVVITKNPQGQIVAVTRQDADGRILKVIDTSSKPEQEFYPDWDMIKPFHDRIKELEEQLAKPEQEPVAWWDGKTTNNELSFIYDGERPAFPKESYPIPLYTSPPRKEWVGLNRINVRRLKDIHIPMYSTITLDDYLNFYRAIENKLKELNK